MKYLNNYNIFEGKSLNREINAICRKYDIRDYTINKDGSIDVDNCVYLYNRGLTELPLKFNRVSGYFYCEHNKLTSLEGSPKYVGSIFSCCNNMLTTLEGGPKYVGVNFHCSSNKILSLEGYPEHVGGTFNCTNNPVFSIVQYFIYNENKNNLIELFNYYDIVQDMNVIYDRLEFFYDGIGRKIVPHMLKDIENEGYKIIY